MFDATLVTMNVPGYVEHCIIFRPSMTAGAIITDAMNRAREVDALERIMLRNMGFCGQDDIEITYTELNEDEFDSLTSLGIFNERAMIPCTGHGFLAEVLCSTYG